MAEKYTPADIERMKEKVRDLRTVLTNTKDPKRRDEIENEIRGLENNISGRYN